MATGDSDFLSLPNLLLEMTQKTVFYTFMWISVALPKTVSPTSLLELVTILKQTKKVATSVRS